MGSSWRLALILCFCFQEGFVSTESFLYKFLSVWDGSLLRSQILELLSHIPLMPSNCECALIKAAYFKKIYNFKFRTVLFLSGKRTKSFNQWYECTGAVVPTLSNIYSSVYNMVVGFCWKLTGLVKRLTHSLRVKCPQRLHLRTMYRINTAPIKTYFSTQLQ